MQVKEETQPVAALLKAVIGLWAQKPERVQKRGPAPAPASASSIGMGRGEAQTPGDRRLDVLHIQWPSFKERSEERAEAEPEC